MIFQDVIFEDKYPKKDLETVEEILLKHLPEEEITFPSEKAMAAYLKKRIRKR